MTIAKRIVDVNTARAIVLLIFLASYAWGLWRLLWGRHYAGYVASDYLDLFLAVYSVPFSIVLVGVLAKKPADVSLDAMKVVLLYGATLIWNAFIIVSIYQYFQDFEKIVSASASGGPDLTATLTLAKDKLAFLISGILTYVYASGDQAKSQRGDSDG